MNIITNYDYFKFAEGCETMNAKEYLNRVRFADISINTKSDELYHLKLKSLQVSPQSQGERVQSSVVVVTLQRLLIRLFYCKTKSMKKLPDL